MAKEQIKPVWFKDSNKIIEGLRPIPVYEDGNNIVTAWEVPLLDRIKLLFTGRLFVVVRYPELPPLTVLTDNPVETKEEAKV